MAFGGWTGARFDAALERALLGLGYAIDMRTEHRTMEGYYRWLATQGRNGPPGTPDGEPPSVLYFRCGELSNGPMLIEMQVRHVRSPRWNVRLCRGVTAALGGFGVVYVNDKQEDDYGYGVHFAGCTIEAAVRSLLRLEYRAGFDASIRDFALFKLCTEGLNYARFSRYITAIEGDQALSAAPPITSWTLRAVPDAPDLDKAATAEPAFLRAVLAGGDPAALSEVFTTLTADPALGAFQARLDDAWPIHDPLAMDAETYELKTVKAVPYLSLHGKVGQDPAPILALADKLACAALVIELRGDGKPFRFWSRSVDGQRQGGEGLGAEAFFGIWAPLCAAVGTKSAQFCWPEDPRPAAVLASTPASVPAPASSS